MNLQVITMSNQVVVLGGKGNELSFAAPLNVLHNANKQRSTLSIRAVSSPTSPSSSTSSEKLSSFPDGMKSLRESQRIHSCPSPACRALRQGNTIGVIGGVSVLSTLIFLEKLVLWSSRNGQDSVPFIVCSDPSIRQESKKSAFTTKTCYLSSSYDSHNSSMFRGYDQCEVAENLKSKRVFLEEGGARCLLMPCHLSHAWYGEISRGCELPFLHIAQCVAQEIKKARFKPLEAGSGIKVGLIATEEILMAGFYQDELQKQGFEVALPDKETMEHIIKPAMKCLKQKDIEGARNLLRIAIQLLLVRAVNTVIIASDELQSLLPHDDPLMKKCIDPLDALARSAVRWAMCGKATQGTSR